jgi:hypothetical protein
MARELRHALPVAAFHSRYDSAELRLQVGFAIGYPNERSEFHDESSAVWIRMIRFSIKDRIMKKPLVPHILLLIIFVSTFACRWPAFEEEQQIDLDERTYYIDPSTILQSLAQGNKDVFILQTATPESTLHSSSVPVSWKQADYYFIAQSFYRFVLGNSLDDWILKEMYFKLNCDDASSGLQEAGFTFFRTVHSRDRSSRLMNFISIAPRENEIYFSETEYYPELEQWSSLDLAQIKISAESAFQIAESAGGSKTRINMGNNCHILETIEPGGKYKGWDITYSSNDPATSVFQINIDPLTGKYKIVK